MSIYKVSFALKNTANKSRETLIMMVCNWGYYEMRDGKKVYVPLKYSTRLKTTPRSWLGKSGGYRVKSSPSLNSKLTNYRDGAEAVLDQLLEIEDVVTPPMVRDALDKQFGRIKSTETIYLDEYYQAFIDQIKTGARLTRTRNPKRYARQTIAKHEFTLDKIQKYQKKGKVRLVFMKINKAFYDDFMKYLNDKKLMANSVGGYIKNLKAIMRFAMEDGLHTNTDYKSFIKPSETRDKIYLTESEIAEIYKLDLSEKPKLDKVRDLFLIGCWTAQRFGDYSKISKHHIRTIDGNRFIEIVQSKTDEKVIIPIRPELEALLKKYDYNVPSMTTQFLNENIKLVGRMAKILDVVEDVKTIGGRQKKEKKAKCLLISSHTARRSGCTNMYLAKIPVIDIMKISGHKTESEFLKYIRVTKEETAVNLATHSYFTKKLAVS